MIIKSIHIENYQCYYGISSFHFEDGLNIILAENNEGKTKFFEAVDWLFNGQNTDLEFLTSAKRLKEIADDDSFRVSVSMIVDKFNSEYRITRSFTLKKKSNNEVEIFNFKFEGEVNDPETGQREPKTGNELLDRIFPFEIRKYSLFKGETELNIFDNEEALASLINLFSDARHFDKYASKGAFLREKAETAVEQSTRQNQKNKRAYDILEGEIGELFREKKRLTTHLNSTEEEISKLENLIVEAETYRDNSEAIGTINKIIQNLEEKISHNNKIIDENYTTSLFDKNWILIHFEIYHEEFTSMISKHSKIKRELQSDFDKQQGIREGVRKAKAELLNSAVPLPIGVPSKSHMEEMLGEEICKVCNREAKKGSEPFEFMVKRLQLYLESQSVSDFSEEENTPLFKFDYTNRLDNMAISHEDNLKNLRLIRGDIQDRFELNDSRKADNDELESQIMNQKQEKERIFGLSDGASENELLQVFKNYSGWQEDLRGYTKDKTKLKSELQTVLNELKAKNDDKEKIDIINASSYLIKTRDILRDIEKVFIETKELKFDEFIEKLERKSNKFLNFINAEALTGQIKFTKKRSRNDRIEIDVSLFETGGRYFVPGTAVRTSMNISILLAISELANEVRAETYPLIFDAPTSSFGETKTGDFLNLIFETKNQKIILLKDFVASIRNEDKSIKDLFIKNEFDRIKRKKAFWIKLDRPFDKNDLSTISAKVTNL